MNDMNDQNAGLRWGIIISIGLLLFAYCFAKPYINGDVVAYCAVAIATETNDFQEVHTLAYKAVQDVATPAQWHDIIAGSESRKYSYRGENSWMLTRDWICKFQPRVLYNWAVWALWRLGVPLATATHAVSAACLAGLVVPLYLLLGGGWHSIVATILVLWTWRADYLGRLSSPDAMAALGTLWAFWALLNRRPFLATLFLVSLPLVRPDLVLLSFAGAGLLPPVWLFTAWAGALVSYYIPSIVYQTPGWWTWFYRDCIKRVANPNDVPPVRAQWYFMVMKRRWPLLFDGQLARTFWALAGVAGFATRYLTREFILLGVIPVVYVTVHFFVFPFSYLRFFAAPYMIIQVYLLRLTGGYLWTLGRKLP